MPEDKKRNPRTFLKVRGFFFSLPVVTQVVYSVRSKDHTPCVPEVGEKEENS
jgi:hypothetical protein